MLLLSTPQGQPDPCLLSLLPCSPRSSGHVLSSLLQNSAWILLPATPEPRRCSHHLFHPGQVLRGFGPRRVLPGTGWDDGASPRNCGALRPQGALRAAGGSPCWEPPWRPAGTRGQAGRGIQQASACRCRLWLMSSLPETSRPQPSSCSPTHAPLRPVLRAGQAVPTGLHQEQPGQWEGRGSGRAQNHGRELGQVPDVLWA